MECYGSGLKGYDALKEEVGRAIKEKQKEIVLGGYCIEDIDDLGAEFNLESFEKVLFKGCILGNITLSLLSETCIEFHNCNFGGREIIFSGLGTLVLKNCIFDVNDKIKFEDIDTLNIKDTTLSCRYLKITNSYSNSIDLNLDEVYKVSFYLETTKYPNGRISISFESDIDSNNGISGELLVTQTTIKFNFENMTIDNAYFEFISENDNFKFKEVHINGMTTKNNLPAESTSIVDTVVNVRGTNYSLVLIFAYVIFKEILKIHIEDNSDVYITFIKSRFENPGEVELINPDLSKISFMDCKGSISSFRVKNPQLSTGSILSEKIMEFQLFPNKRTSQQLLLQLAWLLKKEYNLETNYKDVLEEYNNLLKVHSFMDREERELVYHLKRRKELILAKHKKGLGKLVYYLWYGRYYIWLIMFIVSLLLLFLCWTKNLWGTFNSKIAQIIFFVSSLRLAKWVYDKFGIPLSELWGKAP